MYDTYICGSPVPPTGGDPPPIPPHWKESNPSKHDGEDEKGHDEHEDKKQEKDGK